MQPRHQPQQPPKNSYAPLEAHKSVAQADLPSEMRAARANNIAAGEKERLRLTFEHGIYYRGPPPPPRVGARPFEILRTTDGTN